MQVSIILKSHYYIFLLIEFFGVFSWVVAFPYSIEK